MKFKKIEDNLFEIRLSQKEIDQAASILSKFSIIEKNLGESEKMLCDLQKELSLLTQMFLC